MKTYYTVKYQTTAKINNRKKDTPENTKLVWSNDSEKFSSLEAVKRCMEDNETTTYKVWKCTPVEETA
jgi:hypothetical protein